MQPTTQYAEPPIGPDGLLDITTIARRTIGNPEVVSSGIDLAALDAATPDAPRSPFGPAPAAPAPAPAAPGQPTASNHQLLVNEVAMEQPGDPDLPEGAVRIDLRDPKGEAAVGTFVVLGGDDWPSRVTPYMRDPERWHEWAMAVLATDDDKDLWRALDPTNRQTSRFINDFLSATGALPAPKAQP